MIISLWLSLPLLNTLSRLFTFVRAGGQFQLRCVSIGGTSIDRSIDRSKGGELFARARIRVTRPANRIYIGSMFRLIIVLIKTRRGGMTQEVGGGVDARSLARSQDGKRVAAQVGDRILGSINVMRPFVRRDAPKIHPSFRVFNYPLLLPPD